MAALFRLHAHSGFFIPMRGADRFRLIDGGLSNPPPHLVADWSRGPDGRLQCAWRDASDAAR